MRNTGISRKKLVEFPFFLHSFLTVLSGKRPTEHKGNGENGSFSFVFPIFFIRNPTFFFIECFTLSFKISHHQISEDARFFVARSRTINCFAILEEISDVFFFLKKIIWLNFVLFRGIKMNVYRY